MLSLALCFALAAPDAAPPAAPPVEVRAQRLEVDSRSQRAVYTGQATATRGAVTLTCERIELAFDGRREVKTITADGQVVVVDGDRTARGDHAVWDNASGALVVTGSPSAVQGARTVEGERVTFTAGDERLEVERPHTRAPLPGGGPGELTIDADALTLEGTRSVATWRGHVKVTRGAAVLTAPELVAHYDGDGAITRVQGRGGVEATEGARWARGQRADYDVRRGVLVITGQPQARQGNQRMKGSRVTFFPGTERLEVEDATTVIDLPARRGRP